MVICPKSLQSPFAAWKIVMHTRLRTLSLSLSTVGMGILRSMLNARSRRWCGEGCESRSSQRLLLERSIRLCHRYYEQKIAYGFRVVYRWPIFIIRNPWTGLVGDKKTMNGIEWGLACIPCFVGRGQTAHNHSGGVPC